MPPPPARLLPGTPGGWLPPAFPLLVFRILAEVLTNPVSLTSFWKLFYPSCRAEK